MTGRDKDILIELAEQHGLELETFGQFKPGLINLALELIYRWWRLFKITRKWKPDKMMAIAGTYISLVGLITRTPAHVFYDTEHAMLSNLLAYPFASGIHVPECYNKPIRRSHYRYAGYHELAYLHPDYFSPDPSVLDELGVSPDEKFVVIRFVGWGAAHDVGHKGILLEMKRRAVSKFNQFACVFITSEAPLPPDLQPHRFPLPSSRIHDALAFATLLYGESATMASEAAILGTPAIYIDDIGRGYTDEQERKYGLVFNYTEALDDQKLSIEKGIEILNTKDVKKLWEEKRRKLLSETIDTTKYIVKQMGGND